MASSSSRIIWFTLLATVALLCLLVPQSEGFEFSPEKAKAIKAVKRVYAARSKRYTDFQDRASAFCTGLCMYEEKKSYGDCFDQCVYHNYYY